jgi:PAS domain S-box-containing protein
VSFFSSMFGTRRLALVRNAWYFGGITVALLMTSSLSPAVLGQFCAVMMTGYVMQLTAETLTRHGRVVTRNRDLNNISNVLIAAEELDEVQSAVLMAGLELVRDRDDVVFGIFDRDTEGNWQLIDCTGPRSERMRLVELEGATPDDLHPRVIGTGEKNTIFEIVPVLGDELLGALIWMSSTPLDHEFRSAAETLASQMAESIRRVEAQQRIRAMLEHSIDTLFIIDDEGQVQFASPAVQSLTGRAPSQVIGRSLSTLVHRQHVTQLVRHLHGDIVEPTVFSLRWGHQTTKTWRETHTTISLLRRHAGRGQWVFNVHDVSKQTELEVELRHAQKLESVGRLAAGVAHEINTPIQFIGHNLHFIGTSFAEHAAVLRHFREVMASNLPPELQTALEQYEEEVDIEYLEEEIPLAVSQAIDGADRVAEIVRAMKAFGHPDSTSPQSVDVNQALSSTLVIAQNEIKTVAEVRTDFGDVPVVLGYAGDLNQVFLNLVVNACHAMTDRVERTSELGTLSIVTKEDNGGVLIAISDTGTGIPLHARDHVFEPFFTTKDVGQGTGQGLALAHAIVEDRHGGRIWFETQEGNGTTFFVKLPERPHEKSGENREAAAVN